MKTPKLRLPGFSSTPEEREARRAKHEQAKQERAAKAAASSPPSALKRCRALAASRT